MTDVTLFLLLFRTGVVVCSDWYPLAPCYLCVFFSKDGDDSGGSTDSDTDGESEESRKRRRKEKKSRKKEKVCLSRPFFILYLVFIGWLDYSVMRVVLFVSHVFFFFHHKPSYMRTRCDRPGHPVTHSSS